MAGSVTFKHQYNAAGNTTLAYMTLDNGGSSVNDLFAAYTYDSQNRLSTVVDNNLPTGANTTTYLYDLVGNIASVTEPNGVVTRYSYNSLNRLIGETVSGTGVYPGTPVMDHFTIQTGSTLLSSFPSVVRDVVSPIGRCSLLFERGVDAFGIKIAGAGSTPNQILYSGEYLDPGTGNYDLRNRIYQQTTGTFLTADTTPGQLPYVYTADNPVMFADPSGHGFSLSGTLFTISFQMSMIATQIAPAFQTITTVGTLALLVTDQNFADQYIATGGNPIDLLGNLSEETIAGMKYLAEGSSP